MHQFTSKQDFCSWLNQFEHPCLINEWADHANIVTLDEQGVYQIQLPFAANDLPSQLVAWIEQAKSDQIIGDIRYAVSCQIKALQTQVQSSLTKVKNIIAVTSAKGGVGKSTTAVNLALGIARSGASVGLLDADIYGPSVPMMLGQQEAELAVRDNKWMQPVAAHGIVTQSIGFLVDKQEAAVWRGPMASKALSQLLNETEWPELDYLVIDMPPGTGDIQLTLAQQIPVTGALIVTTPQDLALADARKGANMFEKVEVPVVGLVENMSYHVCSHCGHHEAIFGEGGAAQMATDYGMALLAQIPLHIEMRQDIDNGRPTVTARPESQHAKHYVELADAITSRLFWQGKAKPDEILFTMVNS